MLQLLSVEWMKVKNYKTFWILLAITVLSIPGVSYMLYITMDNSFPKVRGKSILGTPFGFPDIWQTASWNASLLFFIPAILIITLTTNEFTYKSHRQNIIDGWSRGQFIRVKLVEILILSIFATLILVLTALVFGYFGNKIPEGISVWTDSRFALFYFVQMLSYSLIAFVLSILIKRAGLAMGLFFIYFIFENIIVGFARNVYKTTALNYLPEEVTDRLIPNPYLKIITPRAELEGWQNHIPIYLAVAAIYILAYCLLTGRYFLKNDL